MSDVPVCVIGCGPIGLASSLLLSRHGVPVLLVERRSELNTHPRSRFVDTNTMELMREFGIEKLVQSGPSPMRSSRAPRSSLSRDPTVPVCP